MPDQIISEYLDTCDRERASRLAPEVLLAESNHRIANNLTLIAGLVRLQASDIARDGKMLTAADACTALEEVGSRIEAVGRLHRLLASRAAADAVDLGAYLQDIAEAAISSMSLRSGMSLRHRPRGECEIAAHAALPVGFIVGELVTNSVKYAHPTGVGGIIDLGCHRAGGGRTVIEVADDGIGLPDGFDPTRDGGLGIRMVRSLARQLGAGLAFQSDGIGLTVQLALPPADA